MKEIIENLRLEAESMEDISNCTASTYWLEKHTQDDWESKHKQMAKDLRKCASILEERLNPTPA